MNPTKTILQELSWLETVKEQCAFTSAKAAFCTDEMGLDETCQNPSCKKFTLQPLKVVPRH